MFRNLFFAAVIAALCAGLALAALQYGRITPLILHAESFEGEGGHSHAPAAIESHAHPEGTPAHSHDAPATAEHSHAADEWAPQDGFERTAYTTLATVLAAVGFALIIGAVSVLAAIPISFANGFIWGMAGFVTFSLAPAFGMPPELPGMPAGDLMARQLWWAGTVLATGGALLLLAKTRASWALAVAIALVVAPHIIGAPAAPDEPSAVPAHLATQFAAITLGSALVFWLLLGSVFGKINDSLATRSVAQLAGARA